jgi:1-acyl-sn-glycerol-3-phosphate acyltransferase
MRTPLNAARTVFGFAVIVLYTVAVCSWLMVVTRFRPGTRHTEVVARGWGWLFNFFAGARVTIEGLENVDRAKSYVFVSNHLSNLDAPFHLATMPMGVRFLAKKELFRVPLFGPTLRAVGMVETDRQARSTANRAIDEQVARVIAMGRSLLVYPEGTRSRDAELHPFKKGAFRIAVQNHMPVLPVTIAGTNNVWRPGEKWWRGGRVKMVFHPPIPTSGLGDAEIDAVREQAHRIIGESYQRIRAEV